MSLPQKPARARKHLDVKKLIPKQGGAPEHLVRAWLRVWGDGGWEGARLVWEGEGWERGGSGIPSPRGGRGSRTPLRLIPSFPEGGKSEGEVDPPSAPTNHLHLPIQIWGRVVCATLWAAHVQQGRYCSAM